MLDVKVRGVIVDEQKILLCKLKDMDFWCLPGGGMESMETREKCLMREIQEEFGRIAIIGEFLYINEFVTETRTVLDFWYEIKNSKDFYAIDLSATSHGYELDEVRFFGLGDMPSEVKPDYLPKFFEDYLNGTNSLEKIY